MPLTSQDAAGLLDGINAAALDKRLSLVTAVDKETGNPVTLLCCSFGEGDKTQIIPLAEIIVGRDLDIYHFPEEVRSLLPSSWSPGLDVGIPGFDTL